MKEPEATLPEPETSLAEANQRLLERRKALGISTGCATFTPSTLSAPSFPSTPKARDCEREQQEKGKKEVAEGWYLHDGHFTIDLPLETYTSWAIEKAVSYFEGREEEEYEARCEGYLGPCLGLAAYMKSRPEFQGMEGMEAADRVTEVLEKLAPGSDDPWKEFLPDHDIMANEIDPYTHFIHVWDGVTKPRDETPLEKASRLAKENPLLNQTKMKSRQKPYRDIVSLMYWHQVVVRDRAFYLSCRQAAEVAHITHTAANSWMRQAEKEGLVRVVRPSSRRRAAEYMFNMNMVVLIKPQDTDRSRGPV